MRSHSLTPLGACLVVAAMACGSSDPEAQAFEPNESGGSSNAGSDVGGSSSTGGKTGTGGFAGVGATTGTGGSTGISGSTGMGGKTGTGGAVGTSGAGGSGGSGGTSGPVVVTPCSDLPAVDQWQNISPTEFRVPSTMEVYSVVVSPQDQTVYAAAGNKTNGGNGGTGVMKSTDCGATWTSATTGKNADRLKTGALWAMLVDPVNPKTLYVANGYGNDPSIYKSTNGGVDFEGLAPWPGRGTNVFVQDIALEKTNPQHLAVNFHANCESPYTPLCFSQSSDGGATWQMFNGPASVGGWHEGATLSVLGASTYIYGGAGGWYTGDGGQTWTNVINEEFNTAYPGSSDIAPDGTIYWAGTTSIYSSHGNPIGSSWTKIPNSPHVSVIIDDGVRLFASYGGQTPQPDWTAPLGNPSTWTKMPAVGRWRGGNELAYDATHHIIYSASWAAGLWRVVTR
jgi:hypothetical protein